MCQETMYVSWACCLLEMFCRTERSRGRNSAQIHDKLSCFLPAAMQTVSRLVWQPCQLCKCRVMLVVRDVFTALVFLEAMEATQCEQHQICPFCTLISNHVSRSISCFVSEIRTYTSHRNTCMVRGLWRFQLPA